MVALPPLTAFGRVDVATLRSWRSRSTPSRPRSPAAYILGPRGAYCRHFPKVRVLYDHPPPERASALSNQTLPSGMLGSLVEPRSAARRARTERGGSPFHVNDRAEALLRVGGMRAMMEYDRGHFQDGSRHVRVRRSLGQDNHPRARACYFWHLHFCTFQVAGKQLR